MVSDTDAIQKSSRVRESLDFMVKEIWCHEILQLAMDVLQKA